MRNIILPHPLPDTEGWNEDEVQVELWVMDDPEIRTFELATYIAVVMHAGQQRRTSVTTKTLADTAGMSLRRFKSNYLDEEIDPAKMEAHLAKRKAVQQ